MAGKVKAVPEGMHTITPHLSIREASKAIEFYKKAFGAEVLGVHKTPDGKVMHAQLKVGDSQFMLSDEFPQGIPASQSLGGSPVILNLYAENIDSLFNQAVAAGAQVKMPLADMFWGDRYGQIVDPFGHQWALAAHQEDISHEEMERRGREVFAAMSKRQASGG